MSTIGEQLSEARRARGKSLADVERAIKIRTKYLEALEDDRYEVIPGDAYTRGFLKTYAEHLELDARALLRQYSVEHSEPEMPHIPQPMEHLQRDHTHVPREVWRWGAVVLAVALVVWVAVGLAGALRTGPSKKAGGPEAVSTTKPGSARAWRPPKGKTEVRVAPLADARPWVEVTVDGRLVWQGQLDRERRYVGKRVRVRTARPEEMTVKQDRRPVATPKGTGSVYDQIFVGR